VLPNLDSAYAFDAIRMEWDNGTEKLVKIGRTLYHQELTVEVKEPGIGGYYDASAFSVLHTIPGTINEGPRRPEFSPGDLVKIQLKKLADVKLKDAVSGERVLHRWVGLRYFLPFFSRVLIRKSTNHVIKI